MSADAATAANAQVLADTAIDLAGFDLGSEADDEAVVSRAVICLLTAAVAMVKTAGVDREGFADSVSALWDIVQIEREPDPELN